MKYKIFDMEGDGMHPTKIYCVSVQEIVYGKKVRAYTITDYGKMRKFFLQDHVLVGHNIIRWDIPHIERILKLKVKGELIDTLPLSWYLFPNRQKHGLEEWGEYFGIKKPDIEDWENLSLQEYIHRCQEDVKINTKLLKHELNYLKELYDNDKETITSLIRYLMFKMDCAREQEQVKWKLDVKKCKENLKHFEESLKAKTEILVSHMPENVEYREMKYPKKPYKADGTLSKIGQTWYNLLDELGLPETYRASIAIEKNREPGNPGSHVQLKKWLFSLGWVPTTFKFKKDKVTGKVTRIPQISLPRGEGICPSIKKLYKEHPELENIESYYVIKHRRDVLKGFLRDRDEEDYLMAEIAGLTNTLRFKHTTIVNLPGYTGEHDWQDGYWIRGVLIAPQGYKLCGSDMLSLEDRTKQHFMYFFDPKYVESMIKPGFDPHLDLAEFAYKMTDGEIGISSKDVKWYKNLDTDTATEQEMVKYNKIKQERHSFKTTNYAAVYGSGAFTLSVSSGMSIDRCTILLKAYWKKNWAVKRVSKSCKTKTVRGQMWLFNPISKFWYSLRYEKDKFSTLNQGSGVFCFDSWVREVRKKSIKLCGQFHDEIVFPTKDKLTDISDKLTDSINIVNQRLKLNRELGIDVQIGDNYSEIH